MSRTTRTRWVVAAVACTALTASPILGGEPSAGSVPDRQTLEVEVAAPRLEAHVSWSAPAPAPATDVVGYTVEVRDRDSGTSRVVDVAGADASSLDVTRLALDATQVATVRAIDADGRVVAEGWSPPFEVLASLSLADPSPFVKRGDGDCCETYWVDRTIQLDAPMPSDVWVRAVPLAFDGNEAHDGYDATDPRFPGTVVDDAIRIPAGQTSARFQIAWWGDEWKRFEYAHTTWGFEIFDHPIGGSGRVHLDQAVQEVTFYEDDRDFWPEVHVSPQTAVEGGRTARVKVSLDTRPARRTVLRYDVRNGTARAGRDYRRTSGRLTLRAGQRVAWIRVPTRELDGHRQRTFTVRVVKAEKELAEVVGRQQSRVRIRP